MPAVPDPGSRATTARGGRPIFHVRDLTKFYGEGTAQVRYRGSGWTARLAPGAPALPGEHVVSAVEGNWLVLLPASSVRS